MSHPLFCLVVVAAQWSSLQRAVQVHALAGARRGVLAERRQRRDVADLVEREGKR